MTDDLNWQPKHHQNNATEYNHRRQEATSMAIDRQMYHLTTRTESISNTHINHITFHTISYCHFKLQNSLYLSGPRMTHDSAHYFHDYSNFTSKVSMFISPCFYNPPLTFLVTVKHLNFCTMSSRRKQTGKSII